jgi:Flp pilus assembly protein TadG
MTNRDNIFHRFFSAEQGLAAVEFALALPLLIILTFGSVEVTIYVLITQKLERVSTTLADLVAQSSTITTAQLNQIIPSSGQVMLPYNFTTDGYTIISSVTKTGTNNPIVNWQYKSSGTVQTSHIGTAGGTATMPTDFTMVDKDNVIITEVFYNYKPVLYGLIFNATQMYRYTIYKPRLGNLSTLG